MEEEKEESKKSHIFINIFILLVIIGVSVYLYARYTEHSKIVMNEYRVVSESGPAHDKTYKVEVVVDGIVFGVGMGKSKKDAEAQAAFDALNKRAILKENDQWG